MSKIVLSSAVLLVLLVSVVPASAAPCESLAALKLADTTITSAQAMAAGAFAPAGGGGREVARNSPICRRSAVSPRRESTKDSDIKMEVWMPATNWNGKFEVVGNGGCNGNIDNNALATGLRGICGGRDRYRHEGGAGVWMQNADKRIDFGSRAVHETTVKGKSLINAFYGNDANLLLQWLLRRRTAGRKPRRFSQTILTASSPARLH